MIVCSWAVAAAPAAEAQLVDKVVAEVGSAVITYSELLAEAQINLLRARGPQLAARSVVDAALLRPVLRAMVDRLLLQQEVRRLKLRDPSPEDLEAAVERLKARFPTPGAFAAFTRTIGYSAPLPGETAPPELLALLKAELQVAQFLNLRLRLSVAPSEPRLRRCFAANAQVLAGQRFKQAEPALRAQLRRQDEARLLLDLLEQLASRTRPRYRRGYTPPARPGPAPGPRGLLCPPSGSRPDVHPPG